MHFRIVHFHHGRRWKRVNNHMDARHCPHCGVTVHGDKGQKEHQQSHVKQVEHEDQLAKTIEELCKRVGLTEESVEAPWTWTAVVENDQEAISGLQTGLQRGPQPHLQARRRRRRAGCRAGRVVSLLASYRP